MKKPWIPLIFHVLLVGGIILVLDNSWYSMPPLGKFLSPQSGFWYNAEPTNQQYNDYTLQSPFHKLENEISIVLDRRMVPHVFAASYKETLFAQGYMHAQNRLFQMDLATRIAEGSLSEWFGERTLSIDKKMRHIGLPLASEKMELKMLGNPKTRELCLSYVAGINFFLSQLSKSNYPVEYKILDAEPTPWNVYKVALIMKYISFTSTNNVHDIALSYVKKVISQKTFETLFTQSYHFLDPAFPSENITQEIFNPAPPIDAQLSYLDFPKTTIFPPTSAKTPTLSDYALNTVNKTDNSVWAVSPEKTASKHSILCNSFCFDTPSSLAWYEIQLNAPEANVYGVSIPGIPGIIAGFNQHIAWGFTDAKRDVLDYYKIDWTDSKKTKFKMKDSVVATYNRIEEYKIKGGNIVKDTVRITDLGPIAPESLLSNNSLNNHSLIVRWTGHSPSNDLQCFLNLNLAETIDDYHEALQHLKTPGLNLAFASSQHIALAHQGTFPVKWERQGDFIMPLETIYLWKKSVPSRQLAKQIDPKRNFVSSASQRPTMEEYPYIGNSFPIFKGAALNKKLVAMNATTIEDMMELLSNPEDLFAKTAVQNIIGSYVLEGSLSQKEKQYKRTLLNWDFKPITTTRYKRRLFEIWWSVVEYHIWGDELHGIYSPPIYPSRSTLLESLLLNNAFSFIDNIHTEEKEDIYQTITTAFKLFCRLINQLEKHNAHWWKKKIQTSINDITYLRKQELNHPPKECNNTHATQMPSYRMIVQTGDEKKAYIALSHSQTNNPGSKLYKDAYARWMAGKFHKIDFAQNIEKVQKSAYTISITSPQN